MYQANFLRDSRVPMQLHRQQPFEAGGHQIDRDRALVQRSMGIFKHRAVTERNLPFLGLA